MRDGLPGIDPAALDRWFADHVRGAVPPLDFQVITGGRSNITFRVQDAAGHAYVLRRPPLGHVLATAHDMGREHRIITALGPTAVPVPATLGVCPDGSVIGAPFYVMAFVEGGVLASSEDTAATVPTEEARRRLSSEVVDALADLHLVDVDAVGLGDLARREGLVARQLKRWRAQWEATRTEDVPAMDEAYELLAAGQPEQRYTGVVHGDYRLGNLIATSGGEVAAVLDWGLCTLGDVLVDVGYLLNTWDGPGEDTGALSRPAPTRSGGFASRDDLTRRYAERTGFDLSGVAYYRAFNYWRSAGIAAGVKRRFEEGVMGEGEVDVAAYSARIVALADRAVALARPLVGRA
jgi:aminoglycoside phosphotransferase (APT) family kinase protein